MKIVYFCVYYLIFKVVSVIGNECKCGTPQSTVLSMRIVGGRRAAPHSFPWTVAIMKNDKMHCGGALVTNKHVLSAGHCFKWDPFQNMDVLLGLDNMELMDKVVKRKITDVKIHEKFTSTAVRDENDIAVATLSEVVKFDENVLPICLPQPGQSFTDWVGTIVGWGRMGVNKGSSKVLMRASLKILSDHDCKNTKLSVHLTGSMMCAYSKGKDGCQGDSGGPFVVLDPSGKYIQVGIVSWGIGCADPRYPGVYTKVADYIDWINKHISDGLKCT